MINLNERALFKGSFFLIRDKYMLLYELNKLKGVFIMLILLGIGSIIIGAVLIGLGSSKK